MKGDEIKILAGKYGVPAGTLEKDFALTIILSIISGFDGIDKVVFKLIFRIKQIGILFTLFTV